MFVLAQDECPLFVRVQRDKSLRTSYAEERLHAGRNDAGRIPIFQSHIRSKGFFMKPRALYDLARFLPLMSWSGNASFLGVSAAVVTAGFSGVNWGLTILAVLVAIMLQYVAHPINDIADLYVDRLANIDGTGRRKVLISGLATRDELIRISLVIVLLAALIAAIISLFRPIALIFGAVGFIAVWAYNAAPARLSYRPFPEIFIAFPANIAMVVGIAYVASGVITTLSLILGLVQAFMAASMLISYFAMDVQSDFLGGKCSTVVCYQGIPWCTVYPVAGIVTMVALLIAGYGPGFLLLPAILMMGMTVLGARIDTIWMTYLRTHGQDVQKYSLIEREGPGLSNQFPYLQEWQRASGSMRNILVGQIYLTIVNGIALSFLLVAGIRS